jgi:hypothetical protein
VRAFPPPLTCAFPALLDLLPHHCPSRYHLGCVGLKKIPPGKKKFFGPCCKEVQQNLAKGGGDSGETDTWSSHCLACGKGGNLICCDGCSNAMHQKCAGLKVREQRRRGGRLRAPSLPGLARRKLTPALCPVPFPASQKFPKGDWFCTECASRKEDQ